MSQFKFGASCLLCLLLAPFAYGEAFKLQIGKETTRIETPLLPDGTPDYLRAYEQQAAAGVTPENNAGAIIQRLLGVPWPKDTPGGPAPDLASTSPSTHPTTSSRPSAEEAEEQIFENWLAFGRKHWENGPQKDEWLKLNAEKQEKPVDRTEHEPWKAADFPLLAQWLAAEEEPLKLLTAATLRPRYFRPQMPMPASDSPWSKLRPGMSMNLGKMRSLANTLLMRALMRAGSDDATGALADLQSIRRLGRLVQQEPTLVGTLIGASIDAMSWEAEITLAQGDRLSAGQRVSLTAEARNSEEFRALPPIMDIGERFFQLQIVMEAATGDKQATVNMASGLETSYYFDPNTKRTTLKLGDLDQTDWNVVLRRLNQDYDALTAAMSETDAVKQRAKIAAFVASHQAAKNAGIVSDGFVNVDPGSNKDAQRRKLIDALETYLRRRAEESQAAYSERIGIFFAGDFTPYDRYFKVLLRSCTYQRQLQIVLALRAYHEAKGVYPAQLSELVPGFIPRIPNDPFAGLPMAYRRDGNGYALYSVGMNGKDDGGKTHAEQKEADDLVVKMDH